LINIAGLSAHDTNFIKAAAVIIIMFSLVRLILELVRFIRQLHIFFADFDTWVEVPLFIFTIIFATVFDRECFCPRDWQWQVGIAAVFLVWVDLILYMRRMRVLGKGRFTIRRKVLRCVNFVF
jgi:transient receptor potential cation channel subfamily A protein 1